MMSDKEKVRTKKKKANTQEIIDINQAAKELGMSYGQYVAMQYQKTMKQADKRIDFSL